MPGRSTLTLRPDAGGIAQAARLLANGEAVALPTETVYGLAADARNGQAVARIYAAKDRPAFNPLIVHLADLDAALRIGRRDGDALRLARAFWPGPLTLVVPLRPDSGIAGIVTAGLDSVGLRVPAHPVAAGMGDTARRQGRWAAGVPADRRDHARDGRRLLCARPHSDPHLSDPRSTERP